MSNSIKWVKNNENAEIREPAYPGDAGFDMVVVEDTVIRHGEMSRVKCGFSMALPDGVLAIPLARTSAADLGIFVMPTLIDTGYRGPMYIFATMLWGQVTVHAGQRIAQLLPLTNISAGIGLQQVDALPPSVRGSKMFGSSGGSVKDENH